MKNSRKQILAAVVLLLLIVVIGVPLLVINGVVAIGSPRLTVVSDAGITQYRSFAEGWEDSTEKYAFTATREQVAMIAQRESLTKTTQFDCEEPTSRNRLASFCRGRPYWFAVKWSQQLEHYAAPMGPPIWKEMVYDPTSGRCLLKMWDD